MLHAVTHSFCGVNDGERKEVEWLVYNLSYGNISSKKWSFSTSALLLAQPCASLAVFANFSQSCSGQYAPVNELTVP